MSSLVKSLMVVGILGMGSGGVWLVHTAKMPSYRELENPEDNSFGSEFQAHMVDTETKDNDMWWKWAFRHRWNTHMKGRAEQFKGVNSVLELKNRCREAYKKKTRTDIRIINYKYEEEIWRYCSVEGRRPQTLEDAREYSDESTLIGHAFRRHMISSSFHNRTFWKIQEKAFLKNKKGDGIGKNANEGTMFRKLYEKENRDYGDKLFLVCQKAYGEDKEKEELVTDAFRFCGLITTKV